MKINLTLGWVVSRLLLAPGIDLLKLKSWARKLPISYPIFASVRGLVGTALNFIFLT